MDAVASTPVQPPVAPPELIPARMLNEFTYCPRLCYLEWVQQEWEDNVWTLEGSLRHRRVDHSGGHLPEAEDLTEDETIHARSVMLSAPGHGFIAKMDLIESDSGQVIPVDYKRGKEPDNDERSWEPERIQLCAQVLILQENGYRCDRGVIYYVESKRRVEILMDQQLIQRTKDLARQLRDVVQQGTIPPPLMDSPKCPHCSLVGICLPDEVLHARTHPDRIAEVDRVRRLYPARDDAIPLYVQEQGGFVGKKNENLVVKKKGDKIADIKLMELSHLAVYGAVQISTQAVQDLLQRGIPILYYSYGGWFHGLTTGFPHKNIELRRKQFALVESPVKFTVSRQIVLNKIQNCRVLLRRNCDGQAAQALKGLQNIEQQVAHAETLESLLGFEGNAARLYFQNFHHMLKTPDNSESLKPFDFTTRNRRPPRDPVNALLSFAYSLLVKDLTITLLTAGFEPYLGFYHQPRYGRPALALDMMEPFRPLIADSTVLSAINNGVIKTNDFIQAGSEVSLKPGGRKRFIETYERRMNDLITHPVFNYRVSYRRVLEVQCRLLGRYLLGEIDQPPEFKTR